MINGWSQYELGDMVNFAYGKGLPERERNVMGNIPVYGSNGIVGRHDEALVKSAGIIIGRKGSIGRVHFSKEPFWAIDTTFFVVDDPKIDLNFVYFMLKNLGLDQMNQDSAVPGLNRNAAHAVNVLFPTLPEQQAIATILGALDDKIDLNRRMNETLESMARAIFKSWFVDFDPVHAKMEGKQPSGMDAETAALFPDRLVESELGLIPEGWEVLRLSDLIVLSYGKSLTKRDRNSGPIPVYGSGGVTGNHDKSLVSGPGIIVGRKGTIGTVYWERGPFYPIDTVFYVDWKVEQHTWHWLRISLDWLLLPELGSDSAVPGLNRNTAYAQNLVFPSTQVLVSFETSVDGLDKAIAANEKESRTLAELRDLLLPKLLSGEIRVKEAEQMVEAAV
jgi:type I restriction enzyme, S subunit